MSQFDAYNQACYIQSLCAFLGKKHVAVLSLQAIKPQGRKGRLPLRPESVVGQLEQAVNAMAARCEAMDSTFSERVALARAHTRLNCAQIARRMRVSREAVRQWVMGASFPNQIGRLAEVLAVPVAWMEIGGEHHLPANSILGVRVGAETMVAREELYGLTLSVLAEAAESGNDMTFMALLEKAVFTNPDMVRLARRAGGRWHVQGGSLSFVPWVPIAPHGLARRCWSDEVEALIAQALAGCRSVYGAWHEVQHRCEVAGIAYPKLISLQKRVAQEKQRASKFGVDLNSLIAKACTQVI